MDSRQVLALTRRLMERRLDPISAEVAEQVGGLSTERLEALVEALFDIRTVTELQAWLDRQDPPTHGQPRIRNTPQGSGSE